MEEKALPIVITGHIDHGKSTPSLGDSSMTQGY